MLEFRDALISKQIDSGSDIREATKFVDDNLIGYKRPTVGRSALYASPDVVKDILKSIDYKRQFFQDWRSACSLADKYSGGSQLMVKKLKMLKDSLEEEMIHQGIDPETASGVVWQNFVRELDRRCDHPPTIYASRSAIRLLEDNDRTLKIRSKTNEHERF